MIHLYFTKIIKYKKTLNKISDNLEIISHRLAPSISTPIRLTNSDKQWNNKTNSPVQLFACSLCRLH